MLTLFFKDSTGTRRKIGEADTEKEIFVLIKDFLDDHKFKSYYTRSWLNPSNKLEKVYDVGSHTEFFICYNPNGWSEI